MSFTPQKLSTVKVAVTTDAQTVDPPASLDDLNYTAVQVLNAGPSIIFIDKSYIADPSDAVVDQSMPIMPGVQVTLGVSKSQGILLSIVGQGTSTAYVTYGSGDLSGIATQVAAA